MQISKTTDVLAPAARGCRHQHLAMGVMLKGGTAATETETVPAAFVTAISREAGILCSSYMGMQRKCSGC